jgi:hypothetical protein
MGPYQSPKAEVFDTTLCPILFIEHARLGVPVRLKYTLAQAYDENQIIWENNMFICE